MPSTKHTITWKPETKNLYPPLAQMGGNLARETARLSEVGSAEKDADRAAVDEQKRLLAPEVKTAREQLAILGEFLKDNDGDLKLLRAANPKSVNGRFHDPTGTFGVVVKVAIARLEELFSNISQARDHLAAIETRVNKLTIESIAARVFMRDSQFPTVLTKDGWMSREPTQIRISVVRETRRIAGLPRALDSARGAVAQLITKINQMEKIAGGKPKKSEATLRDPRQMERDAELNPNVPAQTKADADFSGYSAENRRPRFEIDTMAETKNARPGESLADYTARTNRS